MAYWIAGIDVHKKRLAVVVADVEVDARGSLTAGRWAPAPVNCERWRTGWSSRTSRKS